VNARANNTLDKVRQLQRKLYLSAKDNKKRRFHALYDKVYRKDILVKAWKLVKANGGSGGIDKVSIEDVVTYGEDKFIEEIQKELQENTYHPLPVNRVYIPKKDGSKRPLGIPILKDRVVQMATKIVIEPIFEANFKDSSFGFRPKRNAHQALDLIVKKCNSGGWWVLDADIKSYFDNINHGKLMILVEQKISDRRILKLIKNWLKAGIIDKSKYEHSIIGSPQGGVISPLLSNIYLNYLDTVWEKHYSHIGTLVRYADDLVVICRTMKNVKHAYQAIQYIFKKLELQLHPTKTRIVPMWGGEDGFDFLGFHHKAITVENRNGKYVTLAVQFPSKKSMDGMREKIRAILSNRNTLKEDILEMVKTINRRLTGFKNYYSFGFSKKKLHAIDNYVIVRFTIWFNHKRRIQPRHGGMSKVYQLLKSAGIVKLAS
jgi:group II intron reverse transcriptase/maturase